MNSGIEPSLRPPVVPIPLGGPPPSLLPHVMPWRKGFSWKEAPSDLLAGVTLAAFLIPMTLAYTTMAGLPPQAGLAATMAAGIGYALFCSSRATVAGVTSSLALLVGGALGDVAGGHPERWSSLSATLAWMVGSLALLVWLLRADHIVHFLSESVLLGFKAGVAATVAVAQLPILLGLESSSQNLFGHLHFLARHGREANPLVTTLGAACLLLLLGGGRLLKGRPVPLIVLCLAIFASVSMGLGARGAPLLGPVHSGLPHLHPPAFAWDEVDRLAPLALACVIVAGMETTSCGRVFAVRAGGRLDLRQEFLGIAAANFLSGAVRGMPVSGGMSQSAVNDQAGARSPLSGVAAVVVIAALAGPFSPWLAALPRAALAAVLLASLVELFDVRAYGRLFRISRVEFCVALATCLGVVCLGSLRGVLGGAVLSLVLLIHKASQPHVAVLGRVPGTDIFGDLNRHPKNQPEPGALIFRVDSFLLYFNAEWVRDTLLALVDQVRPKPEVVVFYLGSTPLVDLAGAEMLGDLHGLLETRGIGLRIAGAHGRVRDALREAGLETKVGPIEAHTSIPRALAEWRSQQVAPSP